MIGLNRKSCRRGFSLLEVVIALAILGVGVVSLIELFSMSLRTVRKSEDYSKAIILARSALDEAYSASEPKEIEGTKDLGGGFEARKDIRLVSSEEGFSIYDITVTISWPSGKTSLNGLRTFYEKG